MPVRPKAPASTPAGGAAPGGWRARLAVALPDHAALPPRHPPVPRGPALPDPSLRTLRVHAIFWTVCVEADPPVALIRAASRSRSDRQLRRSECPPFDGTEAVFQARWVKGGPVFVREVVAEARPQAPSSGPPDGLQPPGSSW